MQRDGITDNPIDKAVQGAVVENWHAMVPGLQDQIAHLALTSADTVLYQWSLTNDQMTFSQNISDVYPIEGKLPKSIDEWQQLIDPRDSKIWLDHSRKWRESEGSFEARYRLKSDEVIWVKHNAMRHDEDDVIVGAITFNCRPPAEVESKKTGFVNSAVVDVSTTRQLTHDTLNAGEFIVRLQRTIEGQGKEAVGGVVLINILSLSLITKAFGQNAVEEMMEQLSAEISDSLSDQATIYRIHQEQFGILLPNYDKAEIKEWISRVDQTIREYGKHASMGAVHMACACGFASYSSRNAQAAKLVDKAYSNLQKHPYMQKAMFAQDPSDKIMARQQIKLATYLAEALRDNKLRMAYQPIVNTKTGEISYYEALLRLIDDTGQVSSAGALIPVAERMGLIDMVDQRVMEMVIKELEVYPDVNIAFNVSNLTTENPDWLKQFQLLLHDRPEIASRLIVEITETAANRDLRRTAYFVAMVQELGCQVALDDFGSGYTSFRQLKTLSVDIVKIDGEFIKDLCESVDNQFFVKTLLEFTELFGLKSVAEFVETGECAKMLMELGVDYLQGYYFGKPENYRSWIDNAEYQPS